MQGSPKSLGRAYAEPEFKTVEQFYEKPKLRFYDVSRGRVPAGELLAAFELIELDYSAFGEVRLVNQSVTPRLIITQYILLGFCVIHQQEVVHGREIEGEMMMHCFQPFYRHKSEKCGVHWN